MTNERLFEPRENILSIQPSLEETRKLGRCLMAWDALNSEYDLPNKSQYVVEPELNDGLCTQIAEPEGLHTCDMTTTVNAFIWQGWLSTDQGQLVHEQFPNWQPDRKFFRKTINGLSVLIAGKEIQAIRAITGEELLTAEIGLKNLNRHKIINKVCGVLSRDIVLNVGNGEHARLVVGYAIDNRNVYLRISDPYVPNKFEFEQIDKVMEFGAYASILGVAKKNSSIGYIDSYETDKLSR